MNRFLVKGHLRFLTPPRPPMAFLTDSHEKKISPAFGKNADGSEPEMPKVTDARKKPSFPSIERDYLRSSDVPTTNLTNGMTE